jgi:hypothetical protein
MLIEDFSHGFGPMLDELAFYPFFGSTLENVLNEAGEALFDWKLVFHSIQKLENSVELEVFRMDLKGVVDFFIPDGFLNLVEEVKMTVNFLFLQFDGGSLLRIAQVLLVAEFHLSSDLVVEDKESLQMVFEVPKLRKNLYSSIFRIL